MLSQTCEYALRAVACLARRPGEFVTASDLADATSVPADYLSKVLQQLAGAGLVQGRRGVGGGYRLGREPDQISVLDIVDAMGLIQRLRACPTHGDESRGLCPLHKTVDEAIQAAEDVFRAKTLASILEDEARVGRLCVSNATGAEHANNSHRAPPAPSTSPESRRPDATSLKFDDHRAERKATVPLDDEPRLSHNGKLKARPRRPAFD